MVERLRKNEAKELFAELYQICGALGCNAKILDNISAASIWIKLPHKTLLPFTNQTNPVNVEDLYKKWEKFCEKNGYLSLTQSSLISRMMKELLELIEAKTRLTVELDLPNEVVAGGSKDLAFLKEMKSYSEYLLKEKYDITKLQMLNKMIEDWIWELEKPAGGITMLQLIGLRNN